MNKTVAACYRAYIAELKAYKEWTDGRKAVYGEGSSPMASWGGSDYQRVMAWNEKIEGMERVLGMTEAEVTKANKSVGIEE